MLAAIVLASAALAIHLCLRHALAPAMLVALGGLGAAAGGASLLWDCGARDTRSLCLHADGSAVLLAAGVRRRVRVSPASLRLGRHVLLVLCAGRRRVRLLLGPGNLGAPERAALGRWLQRAATEGLGPG